MKKNSTILIIVFAAISGFAQIQHAFKYQAVVRDGQGELISNQLIGIQVSILDGSPTGPAVYIESHNPITNPFGLISLEIGNGNVVAGAFSNIIWNGVDNFIQIEMDETGGTNYLLMGASQILSVPMALYAERAGYGEDTDWIYRNDDLYSNVLNNVGIGPFSNWTNDYLAKLHVLENYPSTNTIEDVIDISRGSTGTVGSGIGGALTFHNEVWNGGYALSGRIACLTTNVNNPTGGLLFQTRPPSASQLNSAVYIDPVGNVGIGVMNPYKKLEVSGTVKFSGTDNNQLLDIYNGGTGEGIWSYSYDGTGIIGQSLNHHGVHGLTNANNKAGIWGKSNYGYGVYGESTNGYSGYFTGKAYLKGWVGIGTTSPAALLDIQGTSYTDVFRYSNATYDIAKIMGAYNNVGSLELYDHGTERIHISAFAQTTFDAGFVAIGESYPDAMLEVSVSGGTSDVFMVSSNDDNDGDLFVVKNSGNIGIGITNPSRKLHIAGANPRIYIEASSSNPEINFSNYGDPPTSIWSIYKEGASDDLRFYQNGNRISIQSSTGNVSIGTINPAGYKLNVAGTAYCTGGWQGSDKKYKEEIKNIIDPLEKVMLMNGVSYRWKTDQYEDKGFPSGTHFGVIAQEIEKVLPEVVKTGPEGDKAVAYNELIAVLIEAVKKLNQQNEILTSRIEKLEK